MTEVTISCLQDDTGPCIIYVRGKRARVTGRRICTFLTKAWFYEPWETNQWAIFVAQGIFGNQAIIQVFRASDRLSSLPGAKIMAHKQK